MEQNEYPQLKDPEMTENMDRDEYEFAKFEAIQKTSEKEYLNAILASLNAQAVLLKTISRILLAILIVSIYFLAKDIISK